MRFGYQYHVHSESVVSYRYNLSCSRMRKGLYVLTHSQVRLMGFAYLEQLHHGVVVPDLLWILLHEYAVGISSVVLVCTSFPPISEVSIRCC